MTTSDTPSVRDRIRALRNSREDTAVIATAEAVMRREREAGQIRQAVRAELGPTWADLPIEIDRECAYPDHMAVVFVRIDDLPCRIQTTVSRSLSGRDCWIVGQRWSVHLWYAGQPYRCPDTYRGFEAALLAAARLAERADDEAGR
ncbi:MAG: hypothetical protein U0556_10020 [Dehalococcoidia bacterium]